MNKNSNNTNNGATNTCVAKTNINPNQTVVCDNVINKKTERKLKENRMTESKIENIIIKNCRIIRHKQYAESIWLLKKDINEVKSSNEFAEIFPVTARSRQPYGPLHKEYVYFTIPVDEVKKYLYKFIFNPEIKDGPLNKNARKKITPLFEEALARLEIVCIDIPSYVLTKNHINSIFKTEINSPAFKRLIENERKKKTEKKVAFNSQIAGKCFVNTYSENDEHPRVYNMFTRMPSAIRQHAFKKVYEVNMVEIDLTNSIIQCIASLGKCTKMLEAIRKNIFICPDNCEQREEEKEKLFKWIFSLLSSKISNMGITKAKNSLREFLTEDYFDEMEPFIKAIDDLDSPHTLFHYEDILRAFCKQNPVCINVHNAVYIPAVRTDLIESLKKILDERNYLYKVNTL